MLAAVLLSQGASLLKGYHRHIRRRLRRRRGTRTRIERALQGRRVAGRFTEGGGLAVLPKLMELGDWASYAVMSAHHQHPPTWQATCTVRGGVLTDKQPADGIR